MFRISRLWLAVVFVFFIAFGAGALEPAAVRDWRVANEKEILAELVALLGLPNHALDTPNIEANATALAAAIEARGLTSKLLRIDGAPPIVLGEWSVPGATRTVAFYAHYDGQPVASQPWRSEPFEPLMRGGADLDAPAVDWEAAEAIDPEWRLYARSASDDKGPIVALLAAVSALKAAGATPSINVKLVFEGEEERGSPHLSRYLTDYADDLAADAWLLCDGPVHQSRRMQLPFGARGITGLDLTMYGANRGLHSGHYGNWSPNPIVALAHLVTKMRDEEANILIAGFHDDVRPVTPAERKAIDAAPDVDEALRRELGLARTEGSGAKLLDQIMKPSVNVRGFRAGDVGASASNVIVPAATVSIDFRLVPDQTPEDVETRVNAWLEASGYHVVASAPDAATREAHARIVKVEWKHSYPPHRTSLDDRFAQDVVRAVKRVTGDDLVILPTLGGSIPMHLFAGAESRTPVIIVPIVNHDNSQHAANENLRIGNLWDGIEVYAALMTGL